MRMILFVLAVLAFLYGAAVALGSKSAIHEAVGGIAFVVAAVCLAGAGIIEAVDRLRRDVLAQQVKAASGAAVTPPP